MRRAEVLLKIHSSEQQPVRLQGGIVPGIQRKPESETPASNSNYLLTPS